MDTLKFQCLCITIVAFRPIVAYFRQIFSVFRTPDVTDLYRLMSIWIKYMNLSSVKLILI